MSDIIKQDNITILKPNRDVIASVVQEFREELREVVSGGISEIVIDLELVEMFDSMGLGVIISTHNSLKKVGGKLTVTNVSEDIYKLFQAMRLDQHFEVKPV